MYGSKAVHLEVVSDLSTDTFLLCYQPFADYRGCPPTVHYDNATSFVGTSPQFEDLRVRTDAQADAIRKFASKTRCVHTAASTSHVRSMGGRCKEPTSTYGRRAENVIIGIDAVLNSRLLEAIIRGKWHQHQPNAEEAPGQSSAATVAPRQVHSNTRRAGRHDQDPQI